MLEKYFKDWEGHIADEVIGDFLCLLGDYDGINKLAKFYLDQGNRTITNTREILEWKILQGTVVGADEDIHMMMAKQRFFINIIDSERISLPNILGQIFEVPAEGTFDNLIMGAK